MKNKIENLFMPATVNNKRVQRTLRSQGSGKPWQKENKLGPRFRAGTRGLLGFVT